MIALPAARGKPEVDDDLPRKREEHQHRDGIGEEAGGGAAGECDWPQGATFRRNGAGAPKVRGRGRSTARCEHGGIEHRGPGKEDVGERRDERDLAAGVVAGDDLEDDEDEREVDDREPEESFERFPDPVAVETGVLECIHPDDEHGEVGRGEVAHVGASAVGGVVAVIVRGLGRG